MNINLELYKTFYYVAKNESISRAASELCISQPAISKAIKTLEEQLGTSLFIRNHEGVSLTEAGKVLYRKVKDAMDLISSAENDLNILSNIEEGTINIGASKTIIHEYLMPYIMTFHEKYPNINFRIYTTKPDDLIKKAQIGLIDIIFMNFPFTIPNGFVHYKLIDLPEYFVANSTFSHLKEKSLTLKDLEKLPLLVLTKGTLSRNVLDDFFIKNKIRLYPKMEFESSTLLKDFTLAGFGIGLLNEESIKEELKKGTLFKLNVPANFNKKYLGLVYHQNNTSILAKKMIEFILNENK